MSLLCQELGEVVNLHGLSHAADSVHALVLRQFALVGFFYRSCKAVHNLNKIPKYYL